jgi:hypothetical protein
MNALELHKLLHDQTKINLAANLPEIEKISFLSESQDKQPDLHKSVINKSQSISPVIKCILIIGVVVIVVSIIKSAKRNLTYKSYFDRVRESHRDKNS